MSLVSFSNIQDATTIDANDVNSPMNTIYNDYNGNIDSNNIKDGSLDSSVYGAGSVTNAALAGSIDSSKLDWTNKFSNNIKSRAMTAIGASVGVDTNLTATNITFTVGSNCVAFVTVNTGAISSADTEHRPQIWLDGALFASATDYTAQIGVSNVRMTTRSYSAAVPLTAGSHTLSAGILVTAGTTVVGNITAIVLGNVTA